ncbi:acyl carrier protein [Clostridium tertium]|uniref:acyl carrier protein n=1 Tax=Clostridium tertium TaxID=1559 RepID=UPI001AE24595|nr:acyl carrier protein [Clostridium tertium]MBP1868685.1 acyl carrier protein [Clostridium tertium]
MVFEKIKDIVVEQLGVNEDEVKLETNFIEDLGADSLDLFQVVMDIEDAFNVKVDNVENIKTVGDAVRYIENVIEK